MSYNYFRDFSAALRKESLARDLVWTFGARAIVAFGAFFLLLIIGRLYGVAGAGLYALAYSFLLGAGMLARTGMDGALMRYVGRAPSSPDVTIYLRWAFSRGITISIVISIIIFLSKELIERWFSAPDLAGVMTGMVVAIPAYVAGLLMAGFFKGIRKPATASLLENGLISLVAGAFICAVYFGFGFEGVAVIGWAYAFSAWLVAMQGLLQLHFWLKKQSWHGFSATGKDAVLYDDFKSTSNAFFAIHMATFLYAVLGIMVAGWFLSSKDLGLVKSAQQTAVLIGFILLVINSVIPPRFASLYHEGSKLELARLARKGALIGIIFSFPIFLLCFIFPGWVLSWFGVEFIDAVPLLRIMAVAQLVNVATGSVGALLNMTGYERLMRNLALVCSGVGLFLFLTLTPYFGALGAAMAVAFVMMTQNLVALYFVWRRLGIWTLPGPNIFKLFGVGSVSIDR